MGWEGLACLPAEVAPWPQMIIAFNESQLINGFEVRRQSRSMEEDSFSEIVLF